MLTYKRKLKLTKEQASRIDSWIGACRVVYNLGLEVRIAAWKNKQESVQGAPQFSLLIPMMEGTMKAMPYDWIIKGVNGEFYPCEPDIFEKTYELVP